MWEQIRANRRKSLVLVFLMALLLCLLGGVIGEAVAPRGGGAVGLAVALVVWAVMNLVAYFQGGRILLAVSGARRIEKKDHPQLWNVVEEMTIAAGLPKMPDVYLMDEMAPNAFATGRDPDHAAVAVTAGLLAKLNRDQLQGVIAHELAHIKNRDILFMTLMGTTVGAIVIIAETFARGIFRGGLGGSRYRARGGRGGGGGAQAILLLVAVLLAILAPILAQLIYFAASRRREFLADASGAVFTRYPEGLASALETISRNVEPMDRVNRSTAPMYIVNPLQAMGAVGLFSTHPATEERVRILRGMGGSASFQAYQGAMSQVTGKSGALPASALALAAGVPAREASTAEPQRPRLREVGDTVRRTQGFCFVPCPCGVKIKLPPEYAHPQVQCPRCQRVQPAP